MWNAINFNKIYILLSIQTLLFSFAQSTQTLQNYRNCNDIIEKIEFTDNDECIQIILNSDNQLNCSNLQLVSNKLFQIRTTASIKSRNVKIEPYAECENFLIFSENYQIAKQILKTTLQFLPYSKIYFYLSENFNKQYPTNWISEMRKFLYENGVFGFIIQYIGMEFKVTDLLRNENDLKSVINSKIPKDLLHPLVNTKVSREESFRISLFNYTPYNYYPEVNNKTVMNHIDGIEFRLVKDVTQNWNIELLLTDSKITVVESPFQEVIVDLERNRSDMALCAVWYLEKWVNVDLSTYFEPQCSTLFVPKSVKLSATNIIFSTLNVYVWMLFFLFFILSTILLTIIARAEENLMNEKIIYSDFGRTIFETINAATTHAVAKFQKQNNSLKILLVSWILLSFWIGISYTTIYSSRLTMPTYTKPINSVAEFLHQGVRICAEHANINSDNIITLSKSSSGDFRKLAEELIVYSEDTMYRNKLFENRKCGLFALTMKNQFFIQFTMVTEDELVSHFRIMRTCYMHRFTAFAFQKHSPYTKLFNWHIRRYQENGLITKWLLEIAKTQRWAKNIFEDYPQVSHSPKKIQFNHVSGIFLILLSGLLISVISFLIELMALF